VKKISQTPSRLKGLFPTSTMPPESLARCLKPFFHESRVKDVLEELKGELTKAWFRSEYLSLSLEQDFSLYLYSHQQCNVYLKLNKTLREGNPAAISEISPFLRLIIGAFQKIFKPFGQGKTVYRGISGVNIVSKLAKDRVYRFWSFTSASLGFTTARSFATQGDQPFRTILCISTKSVPYLGKISEFDNEDEVVFLPGSAFRVKDVRGVFDTVTDALINYIDLEHIQEDLWPLYK
jgi:hypothetical protein